MGHNSNKGTWKLLDSHIYFLLKFTELIQLPIAAAGNLMALLPLCFPDFVLAFHCWNLTQKLTGSDSEKCRSQTQSLWKTEAAWGGE